jgi:betaine reductase
MGKLAGTTLLLLGERDGGPGPALEACLKDCGAERPNSVSECFV